MNIFDSVIMNQGLIYPPYENGNDKYEIIFCLT